MSTELNRPARQAALNSGLSGVTGESRASGGRYQEIVNDSRPPVRLIRDLFNPDDLNGKYWSTTDPTAEAHITESYPFLDWKLIFEHADEPYIPDTPVDAAGTMMFVYAAIDETNKPTASEDLRTEKEAFPDDAGKVVVNDMRIPGSFDEAIYKSPQREYWKAATVVEISAQINNQTVIEVPIGNLPHNINLIDGTWKYDAKADPETGLVRRYKARFCGRGDMQVAGVDYHETSSPVVSYITLRIILAMACTYNWELKSMDIATAYLNAKLKEPVYMRPGKGFTCKSGYIWKVIKGLYGTCQAGRAWWQHFHKWIVSDKEVTPCTVDPCVYVFYSSTNRGLFVILMLYVDDLITASNDKTYHAEVQKRMSTEFKTTGGEDFTHGLGLQCARDMTAGTLKLHQHRYIMDMLHTFDPDGTNTAVTPALEGEILSHEDCPMEGSDEWILMKTKPYRGLVGSLQFASKTRPDISHPLSNVSAYCANPGTRHWKAALRILYYLRYTVGLYLTFTRSGGAIMRLFKTSDATKAGKQAKVDDRVLCLVDANHAGCTATRKSQSGWVIFLAGAAAAWGSKRQPVTALSSTEAEYIALASACADLLSILNLWSQLPLPKIDGSILVLEDNQACIKMATNPKGWKRTKHIDVRYHFVRDLSDNDTIILQYIRTIDQVADMLTKSLGPTQFKRFRDYLLGLLSTSSSSSPCSE